MGFSPEPVQLKQKQQSCLVILFKEMGCQLLFSLVSETTSAEPVIAPEARRVL